MAKSTKTIKLNDTNTPSVLFMEIKPISTVQIGSSYRKDFPFIFFGEKNQFPQQLIALADNSTIHNALLETTTRWIAGDGLIIEEGNISEKQLYKLFNQKDYLYRLAKDMAMFGGFYKQVIWNNGGQIAELNHLDFSTIRTGKIDIQTKKINEFFYSPDWNISTWKRDYSGDNEIYKPSSIPAFNPKTFRKDRQFGQLIQIKNYKAGKNNLYYAEPVYLAALNYIDIASKVSELHKANIDNGMMPSYHIHLYEDLSDPEKRRRVEKGIQDKFSGASNAGKFIVTWSTDIEVTPKVIPLQINNLPEMFGLLSEKVNDEIISAHRVPPFLANIRIKTGFTDAGNAMREAIENFQNTVILPYQRMITDSLEYLLSFNGIEAKLSISNLSPISMVGDVSLIGKTVTINEYRTQILGLEEIDGGNKLIDSGFNFNQK